jgi:Carbohydrate binding domain
LPSRFSSGSLFRKFLFALLCAALAALYAHTIFRNYRAATLANSDPAQLAQAIELAPDRADYHHRFGRYLHFVRQDAEQAMQHYRRATELNSWLATAWLDLALAHQGLGQTSQQMHALQRALTADPRTPSVAWEAGQQYLAAGQTEAALRQLRVVIEHDQVTAPAALDLAWRATHDAALMLEQGVPATANGRVAFLAYLVEHDEPEGAALAWKELAQLNQKFPPQIALPYVEFLLTAADPLAAAEVWKVLETEEAEFPAFSNSSAIVNAGFEQPNINAGLDWRSRTVTGVNAAVDINHARGGNRSLGIVLDGVPIEEVGVFQYLALQPGTRYQFSAYVRSESIAGAGGLRFEIAAPNSKTIYYASAPLPESDTWQLVRGTFQTPAKIGVAVLRIARNPADQPLHGAFWIDDLELIPQ